MKLVDKLIERAPLKLRKSAGVPVTFAVHRLLAQGNAARARTAWQEAADYYRAALAQDPTLGHIWIQLGHALKESGRLGEAAHAYRRAIEVQPESTEAHLHLGHVAKRDGDFTAASRAYLAAARGKQRKTEAIGELFSLISSGADIKEGLMDLLERDDGVDPTAASTISAGQKTGRSRQRASAAVGGDPGTIPILQAVPRAFGSEGKASSAPSIVFDISDLLAYFRHARSPSGIQRVQIETITGALQSDEHHVQICCFQEPRDEWVEIPPSVFLELCRLSLDGDDTEWTRAFARMMLHLSVGEPIAFENGAFLINLGTSWWLPNYFLFVRRAKALYGVRYVPFVHDMIPIVRSELCPPLLVEDFVAWVLGVFEHADFLLVNSESTRNDLVNVGSYLGHTVDLEKTAVVRLDADYRKPGQSSAHKSMLRRWGLDNRPYVLFVSTIEPRKNHGRAFEAWAALLRRHGARKVPRLVCVGNSGWMNEPIYQQLEADESLRAHVLILSSIPDVELALLYEHSLFTLYPSNYEGWGLPVTEALCYGKAVLASRISSIPEAGGPFADYFDVDSTPELTSRLERLIFDKAYRAGRERIIAQNFAPRAWKSIADQITECTARWSHLERAPRRVTPVIELGAWHSFGRSRASRIWPGMRSTELYRTGANWWGSDDWGCWTKAGGASFEVALPDEAGACRLYLRLLSMPHTRCQYSIDINGCSRVAEGELRADEGKWIAIEVPPHPDGLPLVEVEVRSESFEDLSRHSADPRTISIGIAGFFICNANDQRARSSLLEAVALGNVEDLSAAREPQSYTRFRQLLDGGLATGAHDAGGAHQPDDRFIWIPGRHGAP